MFDEILFHSSFLQQVDTRVRMACAILLTLCLSPLHDLYACCSALTLGALLLVLARPRWRRILHRIATINTFVLFLWCVTPITMPGTELARLGMFSISAEGVRLALLVSIKVNAIAAIFLALVCSMSTSDAGHALGRLRCPQKLVFLFLFMARFVYVIAQEWRILFAAAKLRGFSPRTNRHSYGTLASLLGLLLVRSHARAKRVYEGMLLRGFSGHFRSINAFHTRPSDICFALVMLLFAAGILAVEYFGVEHA